MRHNEHLCTISLTLKTEIGHWHILHIINFMNPKNTKRRVYLRHHNKTVNVTLKSQDKFPWNEIV